MLFKITMYQVTPVAIQYLYLATMKSRILVFQGMLKITFYCIVI